MSRRQIITAFFDLLIIATLITVGLVTLIRFHNHLQVEAGRPEKVFEMPLPKMGQD